MAKKNKRRRGNIQRAPHWKLQIGRSIIVGSPVQQLKKMKKLSTGRRN